MSEESGATQIGLHSVRNLLGEDKQMSLFSEREVDKFSKTYDVDVDQKIDRFGVELTDLESQMMEAILWAFSSTNYQGNTDSMDLQDIAKQSYSGALPKTYNNLSRIPRIRVKQSELLQWAKIRTNSVGEKIRAINAIDSLGTKQFCFYYDRLVYKNNKPEKNRDGSWKKEEVISVDSLFKVKRVLDEDTRALKYYEISPSPIFLDQRESYFMFVPNNWREEVKKVGGEKRASSFLFRFLYFLRYQYELKRRSKSTKAPYIIRWSPQEIAAAIKISQTTIKRNKGRMNKILLDCYNVAEQLGYLSSYKRLEFRDELVLDDDKYLGANKTSFFGNDIQMLEVKNKDGGKTANYLCELFHDSRAKKIEKYEFPEGELKNEWVKSFSKLLETRSPEDVEMLINRSAKNQYWFERFSDPKTLVKYYSQAWNELESKSKNSKEGRGMENKNLATKLLSKFDGKPFKNGTVVHILNKNIELTSGVLCDCIDYNDIEFQVNLESALKRYRVYEDVVRP